MILFRILLLCQVKKKPAVEQHNRLILFLLHNKGMGLGSHIPNQEP